MKPKEFYEIMENFVKEEKRWRSLNIGDIIYESICRGFDFDYHKMKIDEINVEEREVKAHDVEGSHKATLSCFFTQEEFDMKFDSPKK